MSKSEYIKNNLNINNYKDTMSYNAYDDMSLEEVANHFCESIKKALSGL